MAKPTLSTRHERHMMDLRTGKKFILLPEAEYETMLTIIEDSGLALAMQAAEKGAFYDRKTALMMLKRNPS